MRKVLLLSPTRQMRKWRLLVVKQLAQGHTLLNCVARIGTQAVCSRACTLNHNTALRHDTARSASQGFVTLPLSCGCKHEPPIPPTFCIFTPSLPHDSYHFPQIKAFGLRTPTTPLCSGTPLPYQQSLPHPPQPFHPTNLYIYTHFFLPHPKLS